MINTSNPSVYMNEHEVFDLLHRWECNGHEFSSRERYDFCNAIRDVVSGKMEDWATQVKEADEAYSEQLDENQKLDKENDKLKKKIEELQEKLDDFCDDDLVKENKWYKEQNEHLLVKIRELEELNQSHVRIQRRKCKT